MRSLREERDISLVLQARRIPHMWVRTRNACLLYAPALYAAMAEAEWREFSSERAPVPGPHFVTHAHSRAIWVFLLALVVWHWLRVVVFPVMGGVWAALAGQLVASGQVHSEAMLRGGEWYRAVTAMTLHVDAPHLVGNVVFGAVFLPLLCRRVGLGVGLLLVCVAGALANVGNVLMREHIHVSVGFSTGLFAAVGGMAGAYMAQTMRPHPASLLGALGAALAILAMLGAGGERVDYGAHIWGLALGLLLTTPWQAFLGKRVGRISQWLAGLLALGILAGAWWLALARYV